MQGRIPSDSGLTLSAGNMATAEAKPLAGNDACHVQLRLRLKEVPDLLADHWEHDDRWVPSQH